MIEFTQQAKDIHEAARALETARELIDLIGTLLNDATSQTALNMEQLNQAIATMATLDHFISNAGQAMLKARGGAA